MNNQLLTQIQENSKNFIKRFLVARNIFVGLGIVIALEIVWAGFNFFKSYPQMGLVPIQNTNPSPKLTTLSLSSQTNSVKLGDKFTVNVNISSAKKTQGVDVIILYDSKLLSVVPLSGSNPVSVGNIYQDFTLNSFDPAIGRISVSAVTDTPAGVLANGLFGSIVFMARSAGSANINFDFTPGKTTDSNVVGSGKVKDILEQVNNLQITIR